MATSVLASGGYSTPPPNSTSAPTQPQQQSPDSFVFPPHYSFPPFFTLQPVASTRAAHLAHWSNLIQSYCRHHRIYSLSLIDALPTPLFTNTALGRNLSLRDANVVVSWMASSAGGNRAEWIAGPGKKKGGGEEDGSAGAGGGGGGKAWIYWRRPEEWAVAIEEWVDRTGQRGTVLTLYEIVEGDGSLREEFAGMDMELLQKSLAVSVKRGKAQVFGNDGGEGVKFF